MADSRDDARAIARQHTARLLKMLRGYGPGETPSLAVPDAPSTTESGKSSAPIVTVAETPSAYARHPKVALPEGPASATPRVRREPRSTGMLASVSEPTASSVPTLARLDAPAVPRERFTASAVATVGETLSRQRGPLGELVAKARQLARMRQVFRAYLPPHLQDHAELVRLDAEAWIVHTDSASWATRLRYALHNIREPLGQQLDIALPKAYIRVVAVAPPPPPQRRLRLTKRNARLLEMAARNLADERLSAALRRLAARADTSPQSPENNQS